MGIYLRLYVSSDAIDPRTWSQVYEESELLLDSWPAPPRRRAYRHVGSVRTIEYSPDFRTDDGWRIDGDLQSKRGSETFDLPRTLHRDASAEQQHPSNHPAEPRDDILFDFDLEQRGEPCDARNLFDAKTQGEPYHWLIVAVGTLLENRLPGRALLRGDLSSADGRRACSELTRILGGHFEPPAVLDDARLRKRLAVRLTGEPLEQAVKALHWPDVVGPASDLIGTLMQHLRSGPFHFLTSELRAALTCDDLSKLAAPTRTLLRGLMRRAHDAAIGLELGERSRSGAVSRLTLLEFIANQTDRKGLFLTQAAWNAIESAPDPALETIVALATMNAGQVHAHDALLALLENEPLRAQLLRELQPTKSD